MTNKSIEDVREFLAEEVMGWEVKEVPYMYQGDMKPHQFVDAWCGDNGQEYEVVNWKPDQSLEQAFEILEEYQPLHIDITSSEDQNKWICMIGLSDYESSSKINAIIGAVLTKENKTELLEVLENHDELE